MNRIQSRNAFDLEDKSIAKRIACSHRSIKEKVALIFPSFPIKYFVISTSTGRNRILDKGLGLDI